MIDYSGKAMRLTLAIGCASVAATAGHLDAGQDLSGFYVSTDAGLNLTSKLHAPTVSVSSHPGVRGDVLAGYAWALGQEWSIAAELETGLLYNSLSTATSRGQSVAVGGTLADVPLLAHAVLRWQFHPHWIAYAGAGAGGAFSSLHISSAPANYGLNGIQSNVAWQAMAGVRYQFGSNEIGLGFEHFTFYRSGLQSIGNNTILASYTFCF
ncbi:MAG: acyloxyacyl hydrolase [Limisphaerales bacterium]